MATATRSAGTSRRPAAKRPPNRKTERPQWPEWVGTWPRLKGRQTPEFESKHRGDESAQADRCGRFGFDIGLRQMPWQWRSLQGILSVQPPTDEELEDAERENREPIRLWTHRDVCIEATRQQGKTLLIVLLILFHMFVLRSPRIIYTAQRWSTAYDVWKRVVAVINRVPWLKRRLYEKPSKSGNRGVIKLCDPDSGNPDAIVCEVEFGPRSQDFGRGYTEIDLLILDEAYDIDPGEEANLTGAQSAAKNPQTVYISTAPVAAVHPKCHTLAGLHRLGHKRAADLYYALYAAPRDKVRSDPEAWALAQPSYGIATNEREIRSKLQKAKTVEQRAIFDADYLGWGDYPPDEDEIGSPFEAVWDNLANPKAQLVGARAIAVHRSRNRRRWAITAAQMTADGRIHIEVGPVRTGHHTEIAEYLITKVTEWNPIALLIDEKNGASVLEPLLIEAGIEPQITGTSVMAHACDGLLNDALAGKLSHSDQEILNDAANSATMRELPGGDFAWLEDENGVAIPLVAASLAHWALRRYGAQQAGPPPKPAYDRAGAGTQRPSSGQHQWGGPGAGDFNVMTANF